MRALALLAVAGSLVPGCGITHLPRNAPGVVDVRTPPSATAPDGIERPGDPGENLLVLAGGPFVAGGGVFPAGGAGGGRTNAGVELSLHRGQNERSHVEDSPFVYPMSSVGVNLGWGALARHGGRSDLGPLYLEGQVYRKAFGGALGYAVDPTGDGHGPQATVFYGATFLRAGYRFGPDHTEVLFGVIIKAWHVWTWSR